MTGLYLGYALVPHPPPPPSHGLALGLEGAWLIDEAWALRVLVDGSLHPAAQDDLHTLRGGFDARYLVDALRIAPYLAAGVDAFAGHWRRSWTTEPVLHAALGIEYLQNERLRWGAEARLYVLPLERNPSGIGMFYATFALRLAFAFF